MSPLSDPIWRATDDDTAAMTMPVVDTISAPPPTAAPAAKAYVRVQAAHGSQQLAALTGMMLAAGVAVLFYLGNSAQPAQLWGDEPGQGESNTVIITADGNFDPSSLTLAIGATLTIVSAHAEPQVIKASSPEDELFPDFPLILFQDDSHTVTIPADARSGTYSFYSETLPTASFSLTVSGSNGGALGGGSTGEGLPPDPIPMPNSSNVPAGTITTPLPPGPVIPTLPPASDLSVPDIRNPVYTPPASATSAANRPAAPKEPTPHSAEVPNFTIGTPEQSEKPLENLTSLKELPSNPNTMERQPLAPAPAKPAARPTPAKVLHSGAPAVSTTGVENWIALAVAALALFGAVVSVRKLT